MNRVAEITEANFEIEVLRSELPVLVEFWANWCGPCRMLAPVLEEIANGHAGRIKVVKVDVDENPALGTRFGIRSIPALLYFTGGELRQQTIGVAGRKEIADVLDRLAVAA
jgi:thioredoxin 1